MIFVCCCFQTKLIALFVHERHLKSSPMQVGVSKGILLSHHFIYFFFFFLTEQILSHARTIAIAVFSTWKVLQPVPFLKCHLFPEVCVDFPYTGDLSFPAQSLPQWERHGLTFPLLACMCHDCPRLCLPCALVYLEFLDQYLTCKYVLNKCKTSIYCTYC